MTVDASHADTSPRNGRTGRTSAHSSPTLVELRARAKEQKITGYYRMNKATLMAAITPPS
ncbi:Rho termination factor N-terminal domain-containing protein [Acinetobacter baumannii]|uniref:Rho termination factor N-terminal domain-containing protein n=1 Tax=Escherichia coli TaxID=562 RepID=UPI003558F8E5